MRRVFVLVIDALGIGAAPDAAAYGDTGSNTLASCMLTGDFALPNLAAMGLFSINGVGGKPHAAPTGSYARLLECAKGKDTTVGHWELMGQVTQQPFPTYPKGFPPKVIAAFEQAVGKKVLCNLPYSGTKLLQDYGEQHLATGALLVYSSGDSVFQIAAHEDVVPLKQLYQICETARSQLTGAHAVARVIARPFTGKPGNFVRTAGRHDYALAPQGTTALDLLQQAGLATIGVGKIADIFAGKGIGESVPTGSNVVGLQATLQMLERDFNGLCFVNLVDTDMLFGHRNDAPGFAGALMEIDRHIPELQRRMKIDDLLMITADHGCDPGTPSTDHSREAVPLLIWGKQIQPNKNLGTKQGFFHVAGTVLQALGLSSPYPSLWNQLLKEDS